MPRPKTEMTKSGKTIAVRATMSEWNEFRRLGGAKWLRPYLDKSLKKHQQEKINLDKQ
jgi:protoheme ferro-lyase